VGLGHVLGSRPVDGHQHLGLHHPPHTAYVSSQSQPPQPRKARGKEKGSRTSALGLGASVRRYSQSSFFSSLLGMCSESLMGGGGEYIRHQASNTDRGGCCGTLRDDVD